MDLILSILKHRLAVLRHQPDMGTLKQSLKQLIRIIQISGRNVSSKCTLKSIQWLSVNAQ